MPSGISDAGSASRATFWREPGFWLLLLLTSLVYLPRLADATIRGEESRWATVAQEMLRSGDWIIPKQQGEPFPDRPPLHHWLIAGLMAWLGPMSLWAVRLPSAVAMIVQCGGMYAYARRFMSRVGAFAAGAVLASMGQVVQLGRLGESDAMFMALVSGSLLVWHALWIQERPRAAWILGFFLAGLATLVKGPQAPVYFVGGTFLYLIAVERQWKRLLEPSVWIGASVMAAVLALWFVPFYSTVGGEAVYGVFTQQGNLATRFHADRLISTASGWVTYPFRVAGALLPWSLLLVAYASPNLRRELGSTRPVVQFLSCVLAVALPTCWFPAGSVPRYFLPVAPCVALLIAVVIERCVVANERTWWSLSWERFRVGLAAVSGVAALGLFVAPGFDSLRLEAARCVPYSFAVLLCSLAVVALSRWNEPARGIGSLFMIGAFCGLLQVGPVLDSMVAVSTNPSAEVALVASRLPADQPLVSFGRSHHLFNYYFGAPIAMHRWPASAAEIDPSIEYFCFAQNRDAPVILPFPYETIAVVSCDRVLQSEPVDSVVIARRSDATANRSLRSPTR